MATQQQAPVSKFATKGRVKEADPSTTIINPESSGLRFVLVPVSESGKFEGTLPERLSKTWVRTKESYKDWFASQRNFKLGEISDVMVASDIWVIFTMCLNKNGKVSKDGLNSCLAKVASMAKYEKASVHLAPEVQALSKTMNKLIDSNFTVNGINTYLYK